MSYTVNDNNTTIILGFTRWARKETKSFQIFVSQVQLFIVVVIPTSLIAIGRIPRNDTPFADVAKFQLSFTAV